jgi:hypothetical protein
MSHEDLDFRGEMRKTFEENLTALLKWCSASTGVKIATA